MPFDHYIPASYLGRFSLDTNRVRRNRRLWAVDKREGRLFQTTAGELCGLHNFYSLSPRATPDSGLDPRFVDSQWSAYENNLNPALDKMISGDLDALDWLKTLVVFCAALLVRGGDFDSRFSARLEDLGPGLERWTGRDNTNIMRLMELQRLFASVMGARWLLLASSGKHAQITNDLGYTPFLNPQRKDSGIAIPVGPRHVLLLIANHKRVIAHAHNNSWAPNIDRGDLEDDQHAAFLSTIAAFAQRYVIGPAEAAMRNYVKVETDPPPVPEPAQLGFLNAEMARHYEMIYFNCLSRLSSPPNNPKDFIYVDYDKNMPASGETGKPA